MNPGVTPVTLTLIGEAAGACDGDVCALPVVSDDAAVDDARH